MVALAKLASATPGTVREIAERLDISEQEVRRGLQAARQRGHFLEVSGRQGRFNIYRLMLKKRRWARLNIRELAERPVRQLYSLPEAPEATIKEARQIAAERVTRDCLRCKTRFPTTRHGPRYCDPCRQYITKLR